MLKFLARQIEELEQAIAALIESDPLWRQLNLSFRTIKGVADRTVARIMAEMPEIGTLSNKTISKLAGLAPLANDSGKHQGKRAVRGGRASVRDILFIVGSVVARHEPDFIAFQQRLRQAGKPPKVVRIAVAHKLLVRLNAKAREIRLHSDAPAPSALINQPLTIQTVAERTGPPGAFQLGSGKRRICPENSDTSTNRWCPIQAPLGWESMI